MATDTQTLTDADIYAWMEDYAIRKLVWGLRARIDKGRRRGYKKLTLTHDELDTLLSQIGGHDG
jgi:hypothetical protein